MAPSPLLTPFTLGGDLPLKNRMVLAPMTRGRARNAQRPDAMMARYYVQRASAGLLITEGTFISPIADGWVGAPEIYSPAATAGWKEVTDKVHAAGGLIFCQLWHCGRASHSSFHPKEGRAVAASAIAIDEPTIHTPDGKVPHEVPDALTVDGIKTTVADFAAAAANAKAAGFDGVEVHGANGYLIDTFLQTKTNKRTDEYSGESLEGRFRFLKEVLEAVLEVWPANRVGVRLSPNGVYNDQGSPDFREAFPWFVKQLDSYKLAYIHFIIGLGFGFHKLGEPMVMADFRKVTSTPLIANCGYTQESGENEVADGNTDLVSFGRPWITNPDLPARFAAGNPLAEDPPMGIWYSAGPKGYVDYPNADGTVV